jgi:hypothetical protein
MTRKTDQRKIRDSMLNSRIFDLIHLFIDLQQHKKFLISE